MESTFRITELGEVGAAQRLNAAAEPDVRRMLAAALDVPRWIEHMVGHLPYEDDEELRRAVFAAAAPLTTDEIDRALDVHPRIGERPEGDDDHARSARAEQAGLDMSATDVRRRLRDGNIAYERRFDRVFLVRAAGRSIDDIVDMLERRLGNEPDVEERVVERELREIAAVRLARES